MDHIKFQEIDTKNRKHKDIPSFCGPSLTIEYYSTIVEHLLKILGYILHECFIIIIIIIIIFAYMYGAPSTTHELITMQSRIPCENF
jgi:hypothetical protein